VHNLPLIILIVNVFFKCFEEISPADRPRSVATIYMFFLLFLDRRVQERMETIVTPSFSLPPARGGR
jgi:hypothetical protein